MRVLEELKDYFYKSPLAFMWTIPANNIVFDERAKYVCKFGCKNYNRKYSCPPASLSLYKKINSGNYKWAVLFATTYKIPDGYSKWRIKALNRQKELEIQRITTQLNNILNLNGADHLILSGGSCKKCRECFLIRGEACKKPQLKQTSMEAVGIDCLKTMHSAGFDFEMPNNGSINRCGCFFTNDIELSSIRLKKKESFQNFHSPSKKESEEKCYQLLIENPKLFKNIEIISTSQLSTDKTICRKECKHYGKNFACPPFSDKIEIKLWKNAILWEWRENNYRKYGYNVALKKIHSCFFSIGYYFSLSLRDCYCDQCKLCTFSTGNRPICSYRKILSPSMQSQGIDPRSFGKGKVGLELI